MENDHSRKRKIHTSEVSRIASVNPPKRRATYSEKDAKLARIFEDLADNHRDKRVQAAIDLVDFVKSLNTDASSGAADGQSLERILTRLFRGLCSNRKSARLGYFAALLEILQLNDLRSREDFFSSVVSLIKRATEVDQGASKQEHRDHLRGRLNGYNAIVQSETQASANKPDQVHEIITSICAITKENRSLRQEGGAVLCELIRSIKGKDYPPSYVRMIVDEMCSQGLAKTPEGLAVWLEAMSTFHDVEMPKNVWHHRDPLNKKELPTIVSILKHGEAGDQATDVDGGAVNTQRHGARQATPHFVWYSILKAIVKKDSGLASGNSDSIFKGYFEKFWLEAVDNVHFAPNASLERKSLGLQVFSHVVQNLPNWTIKVAFSPKLSGCLCNQAAKSERYLHQAAMQLLKTMTARAKSDDKAAIQIVETLTTGNGVMDFDKRTHSKTINTILTSITKSGLEALGTSIMRTIQQPQVKDEKRAHAIRQSAADNLLTIVRNRAHPDLMDGENTSAWLKELLNTFAVLGLVESSNLNIPPLAEKTREMISNRLSSCLSYLVSVNRSLILDCLSLVTENLRSQPQQAVIALKQADEEVLEIVKDAHETLEKITASLEADQLVGQAYQLLFSMTLFQAYSGDTDAFSVLERLQESYANSKGHNSSEAFHAVVEEIMGFVSKQSALYRKLGEQTFGAFAAALGEASLNSMLDVLDQKETLSGQQALFEAKNDEIDDVEMVHGSETSGNSSEPDNVELVNGHLNGTDEVEDSSDGSDEGDDDEAERFDKLLAETLKTKISTTNGANGDAEDDSSSDESMDDEQMMALEPQLTKVFQERKKAEAPNKKQEQKDAKKNIVNFKNRVLDLLLIYVKQQHANPLAFELILPLLQLVRTTSSKQVSEKAAELLRQYFDTAKAKGLPPVEDPGKVFDLVKAIHLEALEFPSKLHSSACSRSSIFLAKCLVGTELTYRQKLGYLYADTMERAIDTSCGTPVSFWTDFSQWLLSLKK